MRRVVAVRLCTNLYVTWSTHEKGVYCKAVYHPLSLCYWEHSREGWLL